MRLLLFDSTESEISVTHYPPIQLENYENYTLGLTSFKVFNSIPNVDSSNNVFSVGGYDIRIPTGSYQMKDIVNYIQGSIKDYNILHPTFNCFLVMNANVNTLQTEIKCTHDIDFRKPNSMSSIFGFENILLRGGRKHVSTKQVNIFKVNTVKIVCSICEGSYDNGVPSHIIYDFFPTVPPGYKINENPQNVIYLPINTSEIYTVTIRIEDQNGDLINFRGEEISIKLHLKKN